MYTDWMPIELLGLSLEFSICEIDARISELSYFLGGRHEEESWKRIVDLYQTKKKLEESLNLIRYGEIKWQ